MKRLVFSLLLFLAAAAFPLDSPIPTPSSRIETKPKRAISSPTSVSAGAPSSSSPEERDEDEDVDLNDPTNSDSDAKSKQYYFGMPTAAWWNKMTAEQHNKGERPGSLFPHFPWLPYDEDNYMTRTYKHPFDNNPYYDHGWGYYEGASLPHLNPFAAVGGFGTTSPYGWEQGRVGLHPHFMTGFRTVFDPVDEGSEAPDPNAKYRFMWHPFGGGPAGWYNHVHLIQDPKPADAK
eukprot:gnl/Spiro4/25019_TR12437_c0_g1_i1.p1 gnl/Spiro4/25019_TR12437_c0_g1~~gnl/Spiro4/25019_TR12437_c0_g1_i1.p1  ORF type:complete len:234 (+),score=39.78 gnl/Spiro4/25019_TR12437_c0_g1_i1:80-781(+)